MINQFIDAVVSKGAEAILPQNLSTEWLDRLSLAARNFICDITDEENSHQGKTVDVFESVESNLLLIAVTEIVQFQLGYPADFNGKDIPEADMLRYLKCYAMSLIYEVIMRQHGMNLSSPTIENIFDEFRLIEIEESSPHLTDALYDFVIDGGI